MATVVTGMDCTLRDVVVWLLYVPHWGGDVAQLIEHRTGTLPTQVRFPGAARDFLPLSTLSADSLTVSEHPRVQLHAFTSVRMLKIP